MKKGFLFLLLLFSFIGPAAFAQNEVHKKAVDVFIKDFNNSDFEHIYQTFSPEMKNARTRKYYFDFFTRGKKSQGNILQLELIRYMEKSGKTRGYYDGRFEFGSTMIRITTNAQGEITGLYLKKNTLL